MTSRFAEVFRYEVGYRLRSPVTWVFFVLIWGGTVLMVHLSNNADNRVVNAPLNYAGLINAFEFFLVFLTVWMFGDAAIRDTAHRTLPLFSTAPMSKFDYLGGRFAASFVVHTLLLLGFPLMVALCTRLPWLSHFNWAPFRLMAFVQPFLLLTLPNLLVRSSIVYAVATLTRNMLATYLGGLALAVVYLIVVNNAWFSDTVNNLLDPLAVDTLNRITRHWTQSEQELRLIGFPGILVANRVLWVSLAVALLALVYRKFSFTHPGLRLGRRATIQAPGVESDEPAGHAYIPAREATRAFTWNTRWNQLLAVARHALMDTAKNRAFLVMLTGAVVLSTILGWNVGDIIFDTSTWPVTHLIAGSLNGTFVAAMMVAILSLITGELVFREREIGVGDITAAAPLPDWIPVVGRYVALIAIILLLQALFTLVGIGIQTAKGYYRYELGLYAKIMFGTQMIHYLILAALTMAVHVIVNQKAVGHTIVVGTWAFTMLAPLLLPIGHNMVLYNRDPGLVYSDMNGFGPFLVPWLWFKAYWGAWALLLAVLATVFWIRSSESGLEARLRLAKLRLAGAAGRAAAFAALLIAATGGFVFWNTNVLNDYLSRDEAADLRASYEVRFKQFDALPVPSLVKNVLHVEIWPERRALDMSGTWSFVNQTHRAIDTVMVSLARAVEARRIAFPNRQVTQVLKDDDLQVWLFAFDEPLAPGDSVVMEFEVAFEPRGFPNSGIVTKVVDNGAYFDREWLPVIGYQRGQELADSTLRARRGLPIRPDVLHSPRDTNVAVSEAINEREDPPAHMDVTIGTTPDQIAITPGRLVREWQENGRRYFRYVTDVPVSFGAPILSARYAVRRDAWRGRTLAVYYHPTHDVNIDRMIDAMKVSLEFNASAYGEYPYSELRIVEFPRYASFARAHPYTVAFGEGSAFLTRVEEDDVDRTFMVVAHETAHMWFGNVVRPARLRGAPLVSESVAQYNAHLALEKRYGVERSRDLFEHSMERYLAYRGEYSSEWPLTEVSGQNHVYYFKGAVALLTMRDLIGEENVSLGLRRFYDKYGYSAQRPTSYDFTAELRAVAPDSLKHVVNDLFETITIWNVSADSATATQVGDSAWDVTLHVKGYKARADTIGRETEIPMKDLVEIGVFGEGDGRFGEELYRARHWITSGTQRVTVRVDRKPVRAGIDPYWRLIDRVRSGEVKAVTVR